jgi:Xaa-Pro aminopeptidase
LVPYIEFAESPISTVVGTIKKRGLRKGRIGVDLDYLPASFYNEFQAEAPGFKIIDSSDLMIEMRAIKTEEEVKHQEMISKFTVKAIEDAFSATKIGDTDTDIHRRIIAGLLENGGKPFFAIVAAAQRGCVAHPTVVNQKLQSGDVVRVDVGGLWKGYMSDVARTVVVGEPSKLQEDCFSKLARIEKEIIDSIKPGVDASSLFNKCKESFEKEDLTFCMPHIGHGMGLEIHEYPMIHPLNNDAIREGMVLNIEPLLIDKENSGYHIEDLVMVTAEGIEVLTGSRFPTEIPKIG